MQSPDQNLAYQVRGTFRMYETALARYLVSIDLPVAYFHVLRLEWSQDGVSQKYIAANAFMTASVASQLIKKMAKDGLLERRADTQDSRVKLVAITAKGKALRQQVLDGAVNIVRQSCAGINTNDVETAIKVLTIARQNLDGLD